MILSQVENEYKPVNINIWIIITVLDFYRNRNLFIRQFKVVLGTKVSKLFRYIPVGLDGSTVDSR